MVIGITNVIGMILIIHGFANGITGLVSAVVALNVLIVLLYTRFILKDKFSKLEQSGLAIAMVGITDDEASCLSEIAISHVNYNIYFLIWRKCGTIGIFVPL